MDLNIPILPVDSTCVHPEDEITYTDYEAYSLIISGCIIVILCILEKRSEHSLFNKCGRRPALIYPVNMLDHGSDNFGYAMAFGSVTSHCFQLFTGSSFSEGPTWSRSLYIMMYVLVIGLMFYPFFACLTTRWVFVGSTLGIGYTALWLYINLNIVIRCPNGYEAGLPGQTIAVRLPVLGCLFGLFIRFVVKLTKHIVRAFKGRALMSLIRQDEREKLATKHNIKYVKDLLLARCRSIGPNVEEEGSPPWHRKIRFFLRRNLYIRDPTFKYSPRIVSIFVVSLICAYQFGIIILLVVYQLQEVVHVFYPNVSAPTNTSDNNPETYYRLRLLLRTINVSITVSFVLSSILTLFSIFQILTHYRQNIKLMYKGQSKHLPFQISDRHPIFVLSDSLSYSGSQIAYILWGFLIVFVLLFVTCLGLAYLIVLPVFNLTSRDILKFLWNFVPGVLILQVVYILQKLFSRGLLQSRQSVDANGKHTKKVYHNVAYFLLFFYIVLGLFGCFLTIIKGLVLGVIYLARVDRCGLVSGFETWDTGYMYYVSFLHWEVSHRHPVLLVFCDILLDGIPLQRNVNMTEYGTSFNSDLTPFSNDNESVASTSHVYNVQIKPKRLARNRWLKAYTLISNPSIRKVPIEDEYEFIRDNEIEDDEMAMNV